MKRAFAILTLMLLAACARDEESKHDSGIPPYSPPSTDTATASPPVAATQTSVPPATVTTPPPGFATDTVARIELPQAQQAIATNAAVVLDVRTAEAFQKGHIKGAINIPEAQLATRLAEVPRGKMIITYCT